MPARTDEALRKAIEQRTTQVGDCLIWSGAVDSDGYPKIGIGSIDGKQRLAPVHRVAWELDKGIIPADRVLGRADACDNRLCVALDHLKVTSRQNVRVMVAARDLPGTYPCGHERTAANSAPSGKASPMCRTCRTAYLHNYNRTRRDYAGQNARRRARAAEQRNAA